MQQNIGIFGLGLIGSAIATRLIDKGFTVSGYDPHSTRRDQLVTLGGTAQTAERIWETGCVFSCVFDTDQLETLITDAPNTTATLISVSTCDPDRMAHLGTLAARKGITLIEAPISGTSRSLAAGDVLLLIAGDKNSAATLAPVFDALSRAHIHVGDHGNGNRAKLAINLVLGLNRAALAEGMVFAETLGITPHDFLSLAKASAAYSSVMDGKGALMADRNFAPQGRIVQSNKDFALISQKAADAGQLLPFTQTYLAMMQDALDHGEADLDNSAVLLPIARSKTDAP
ncbi:3-hydroxyisobutyrate dehydrogenase-like beta-hydroxyacid dehydrogenase [Loktanella ponticola]|uniref:3-hydroxyisobutyrate dehydrogenase-like beta-hydroxyacid dehydrogenase n=1 Tax=Yoonia ponticola TaxID=1524255 RepID=A0A7W9BHZ8_9RHOB|nr:NAD(P)-dependent oxidoreductase [Yoonia ponticola]MBB5720800.1 3-hydroxyisobutyrate dehydrogenase-like beta-hydroxyacid dehydrogenase [Yoonia ponticola]